jgi:hypothetical protein
MTYRPNRLTIGYERAKVLNPWVFADLRQPQRMRGFVSPLVYQTSPPTVYHPNLSGLGAAEVGAEQPVTQQTIQEEQRALQRAAFEMQKQSVQLAKRMAAVSLVSLSIGVASLAVSLIINRDKLR